MDVILTAVLTAGADPFNSGKKLGVNKSAGDFNEGELWEYMRPFAGNILRFRGLQGVVLHDGLSDAFQELHAVPGVSYAFAEADPSFQNYERRFMAFRAYLRDHPEIERVWMIDAADIALTANPFDWYEAQRLSGCIATGDEWVTYALNPWWVDNVAQLPPKYRETLIDANGGQFPLNPAAWGGERDVILRALDTMIGHIEDMKAHLDTNPPAYPILLDISAFAMTMLETTDPVKPFHLDGILPLSPAMHNREIAVSMAGECLLLGEPLPADLAVQINGLLALDGWADLPKMTAMARLVLAEKPQRVVEIGVFGGRSLFAQVLALRYLGSGHAYAIDAWTNDAAVEGHMNEENDRWWSAADLDGFYAGFVASMVALDLSRWVRVIRARSERVVEEFERGSIDILHIDGNHCETASTRDVALYLPKVRRGGWIWIDDSNWSTLGNALKLMNAAAKLEIDSGRWQLYRKN